MEDRRRHKRYKVDLMEINGRMVLAKSVKILDISIGVVCLQTEKRLNVGGEYTLKMEGKGKSLTVRGTIAWALLISSSVDSQGDIIPVYKAGMKFINVPEEKMKEIVNFIEDHKRDVDKVLDLYSRRLYVRIGIEDPEKAVLDYHEGYKVKNISLGGMLVESEHLLEIESQLPMEMILNEEVSIRFLGRIIDCLLVKDIEHYDMRVEFIEMSEKDKEILVEFLSLLDTIDETPPSQ